MYQRSQGKRVPDSRLKPRRVAAPCQIRKELGDLRRAHLIRVTLPMEKDELAHPVKVGQFGAVAVVSAARGCSLTWSNNLEAV